MIFNIELEWLDDGRVIISGLFCRQGQTEEKVEVGAVSMAYDAPSVENLTVANLRKALMAEENVSALHIN